VQCCRRRRQGRLRHLQRGWVEVEALEGEGSLGEGVEEGRMVLGREEGVVLEEGLGKGWVRRFRWGLGAEEREFLKVHGGDLGVAEVVVEVVDLKEDGESKLMIPRNR